jgi:hypothetical protein
MYQYICKYVCYLSPYHVSVSDGSSLRTVQLKIKGVLVYILLLFIEIVFSLGDETNKNKYT